MKTTTLLIFSLLIIPPTQAAMTCPSIGGHTITQNGKTYCQKTTGYTNYWSAETWCNAVGGKLVDILTECGTSTPLTTTGNTSCLKLVLMEASENEPRTWTSTVQTTAHYNYRVNLYSGAVYINYPRDDPYTHNFALCVD